MNKKYFFYLIICLTIGIALFSTCKKEIPVTDVKLNTPQSLTVTTGDTLQLIATVYPENATNKKVTWLSYYRDIATVNDQGIVITIAEGGTIIEVITEDGNKTAKLNLGVQDKEIIPVTGVTLNKSSLILASGETETLIATVQPDSATNKNVTWESTHPAIATVSKDGVVTAILKGETTIMVTTSGYYAYCSVSVDPFLPGDYRDKWIGSYNCEKVDLYNGYPVEKVIVDVFASGDSILYLSERNSQQLYLKNYVKVLQDGRFSINYKPYALFGNFSKDSIYVRYVSVMSGGTGVVYDFTGNKNKN